jgi:hypothetical protein
VALDFTKRTLRNSMAQWVTRSIKGQLWLILAKADELHRVVDLQDIFLKITFDNICSLEFGKDLETLSLEGQYYNVSNISDTLDAAWTGYPSLAGQAAHVTSLGKGVVNAVPSVENYGVCSELPLKTVFDSIKTSLVPSMVRTATNDSSSNTQDIDASDLPDANMPVIPDI